MAQRLHRERRQPEHRRKMGYLEKKQDYKKRALDHHQKAERIKKLKNKALERNPNEFHFHMLNSRIIDGVHQDRPKPMEPSVRRTMVKREQLLKKYNEKLITKREIREREEAGVDLTEGRSSKRIVFE